MENEPVKPNSSELSPGSSPPDKGADSSKDDKIGTDAAAMSARILALQGQSDEYTYTELPQSSAPQTQPRKVRRRSTFINLVAAVILFGAGGYAGNRLEKRHLNPPVATINGQVISSDEFAHACEISSGKAALKHLIDDKLVLQFASKKGVVPDQKSLDAKFNELSRSPDFFKRLKASNQSPNDFKNSLLLLMCRQAIVSNGIRVNPQDIRAYYDRNIDRRNPSARFFHAESVQVAVIITQSEASIRSAQKELSSGVPFTAVVTKYSTDVSKARSGVLPVIKKGTVSGARFPGLEKALFDLQTNMQSEPVRIGSNWWLIRCLAHNPEVIDPFEKVQEECNTGLLYEMGLKNHGEELKKEEEEFVKKSTIDIPDAQYTDVSPKR